jgi:hypothetical protein
MIFFNSTVRLNQIIKYVSLNQIIQYVSLNQIIQYARDSVLTNVV